MAKSKKEVVVPETGEIVDLEGLIGETMKANPKGRRIDVYGREVGSPVPLDPPLGFKKEVPMAVRIREMVRAEHLRLAAEAQGFESFEEADDFEIGDDYDPRSPYEEQFEPPLKPEPAPPPKAGAASGADEASKAGEAPPEQEEAPEEPKVKAKAKTKVPF